MTSKERIKVEKDKTLVFRLQTAYEQGFSEAIEKAAKIADEICDPDEGYPITKYAEQIRALRPESGGK